MNNVRQQPIPTVEKIRGLRTMKKNKQICKRNMVEIQQGKMVWRKKEGGKKRMSSEGTKKRKRIKSNL